MQRLKLGWTSFVFDHEERSGSGPKKGKVVVVGDLRQFPEIDKQMSIVYREQL